MDFLKKIDIKLIGTAFVLWLCSMLLLLLNQSSNLSELKEDIQYSLERVSTDLNVNLNKNDMFNNKLGDNSFSFEEFEDFDTKGFIFLVFKDDNLVFWNGNEIEISISEAKSWKEKSVVKLDNGYYYFLTPFPDILKRNYKDCFVAALYPIKFDYSSFDGNKYLKNVTNSTLNIPDNLRFSTKKPSGQVASVNINEDKGSPIYIYFDEYFSSSKNYWIIFFMQLIAVICMVTAFVKFAASFFKNNYLLGLGAVSLFCLLLLMLIFGLDFPIVLSKIPIFSEVINSEIKWISVGEILLTISSILIIVGFLYRYVEVEIFKGTDEVKSLVYYTLTTFVFSMFLCSINIMGGLIVKSDDTNFLLSDLLSNKSFTIWGFLGIFILISIYFFASRWFLKFISNANFEFIKRIFSVFIGLFPLAILQLSSYGCVELNFSMFLSLIICLILPIFKFPIIKEWRLQHILIILVFTSFLVTIFILSIENNLEKQNRIAYAKNLAKVQKSDNYLKIRKSIKNINSDKVFDDFLNSPLLPISELERRLEKKYFTKDSLNLFNSDVQIFDLNKKPLILNAEIQNFEQLNNLLELSNSTELENLYQIQSDFGDVKYLALYDIPYQNSLGQIAIQLTPKNSKKQVQVDEVNYFDKGYQNDMDFSKYNYAIYIDNNLYESKGNFSYSKKQNIFYPKKLEDSVVQENFENYSHLFYSTENNKTVVVSKMQNKFIKVLSVFSILFFVLTFTVVFIVLVLSFFQYGENKNYAKELFYSSFRKKISTSLFVIILFSFFLVGIATSVYFSNRFNREYENSLSNKRTEILKAIDNEYQNNTSEKLIIESESPELLSYLKNLSIIHDININIYDLKGRLIASSIKDIYEKGLIGPQMHPYAYQTFYKKQKQFFINSEKIGQLNFKAAYGTIEDTYGSAIGYIHLPNFKSNKDVSSNIFSFISTILNAYVIILLLSSFLALYLTRSLTRPLQIIGQKINQIRLGQKNEELIWEDDDEIGELISRYNDAVHKLESSAKTLAESERQIAYEQMAKQISHEVKNPLTPMKLSIQQLQRVSENNDPRLKDHVKRMCNTLIEQIDHLERVASEFSFFARAKEEKRELLDLLAILNSVIFLYKETRAVKIVKIFPESTCLVLADRTQLTKVFHNILKNAMQAVRHKEQGVIFVNVKIDDANSVLVSFTDNGYGIPADGVEQVFQPNFTTKTAGMGLGLAICRNIIEDMNGEIWLESIVDEGTTFFIKLPLAR